MKAFVLKLSTVVLVVALGVTTTVLFLRHEPEATSANSESVIDEAIRTKNPQLCEQVTETSRPGPTDGPVKIIGQEAIDWCKEQVNAGERIRGG